MTLTTPAGATVPVLEMNGCVWFKANDCASAMLFKDSKKAIKRHVEEDWQKPLKELLQTGGAKTAHHQVYTLNDLNAKWISEPGLYDLASSSAPPSLSSGKDRLSNVLITIQDMDALFSHLQELNGDRAYHGTDWYQAIPAGEEPNGEDCAQMGYDTCLEDVMRYLKGLSTGSVDSVER